MMMMMMRLLLLLLASSGDGGWLLLQNAAAAIVGDSSSQWWRQRRESLFGTVVVDRNDGMDSNNNAPPPADPYQQQQQRQLKSPLFSCCRLTKNGKMNNNSKSNNSLLSFLTCIRGGAAAAATAQQGDHTDDDSDDIDLDIFEKEGDAPSSTTPPPAAASNINTLAVKIRISTGLHSPLLDQRIEFTASSKRTVSSIKQAISKTMPGRPPISCIQLRYRGRLLSDHAGGGTPTTVNDIISQNDDDEDDDDEDEDEEEDSAKLSLTCDILPPIDSKFGIEFRSKIASCSTREIIEAYCLNMAGMMYGQEEQCLLSSSSNGGWGEEGAEHETMTAAAVTMIGKDPSLNIRKRAAFLQKQLFETMFTDETKLLIEEEHARVMRKKKSIEGGGGGGGEEVVSGGGRGEGEEVVVYGLIPSTSRSNAIRSGGGRGGRKASKGGATMHVKKALQKNLNVNWADTTRNSLLFLFFGYFGGRNSFSRTFLLLSSPLCFFLQTRPVKVAMKQLFYTIGEPPGIFLSLLPAPQQAILSCNYGGVMKGLYGEEMLEGEEWLELEQLEDEEEERNGSVGGGEYNDDDNYEFDQYDDEPDSDEDY